jgi:RING finger and CHY zinc finger domain-containing protein 1
MKCGHWIHSKCYKSMLKNNVVICPLCQKYVIDVDEGFIERLDKEIAETDMPEEYREIMLQILCNECEQKSEAKFHIFGLKCGQCGSYNTKRIID